MIIKCGIAGLRGSRPFAEVVNSVLARSLRSVVHAECLGSGNYCRIDLFAEILGRRGDLIQLVEIIALFFPPLFCKGIR
jgi:hypothetical protein